ncbi:ecto-ADP-ribosyltransferase 3 isoform X1 [Trachypithecus francoisi]|uniref:ecto-ADP-ribosyltransferase 3 isoform X1 n=1 Tax=Trachypithecus francoisi TaxID=54180 RepID=UPI00141BA068|nr:ecto-ADP-ribosyltransferase 3 isoform X1 [Trachypithecus francoisi]XP_033070279.1 ecto-ADP-ribosyltransferase 3 isoform X1 [Trachypithecus francoisi]XP_033070280.1 ecto-ADP-ribosyltransferase 3 isoform X1 [Trachypithecus francoisi]XP_033070281.1 ecto-ADP-ribosyltransferase 3 isoform X1 [Trachypithecus francoisi]
MKTGHFEIVTMLLATMILVDIFQVKAEVLDMADNAFDDEYLKCTDRMEIKYVPQLLKEEKASHQQLDTVWENAKVKWAARKTQLFLPVNFKDNHGIALMAYISEAQEQTPFYHLFSEAVKMAGQSREDYIYGFQFKAFHFYLTRALQLLRRPCEASSKNVVYRTSQGTSFTFGGLNQARFGHFTLAYSVKPQAADDQLTVLSIYTCLGVDIEKFLDKESERITLIPLNEVFQVSQEGAGNNLILQSTNKTCSHYECAFLGGLKTENCVENLEYFQPIYVYNPGEKTQKLEDHGEKNRKLEDHGEKNQKLEDRGVKILEPTKIPGMKIPEPFPLPEDKSQGNINNPTPGPVPVPGPKSHPSASLGKMLLPQFGMVILISVSAINLFVAL